MRAVPALPPPPQPLAVAVDDFATGEIAPVDLVVARFGQLRRAARRYFGAAERRRLLARVQSLEPRDHAIAVHARLEHAMLPAPRRRARVSHHVG